jgi:hypothetical protein
MDYTNDQGFIFQDNGEDTKFALCPICQQLSPVTVEDFDNNKVCCIHCVDEKEKYDCTGDIDDIVPIPAKNLTPTGKVRWTKELMEKEAAHYGFTLVSIRDTAVSSPVWLKCRVPEHEAYETRWNNFSKKNGSKHVFGGCEACSKAGGRKGRSQKILDRVEEGVWVCKTGHKYATKPDSSLLRGDGYCSRCRVNLNEEVTRLVFQEYFPGKKFPNRRPGWLCGLELDGYCEELKLAFEYNGIQHYQYVPHFHETLQKFETQQKNDLLTIERCVEKGIRLIIVPYTIKTHKIRSFVHEGLAKLGCPQMVQLCSDIEFFKNVDIYGAYSKQKYEELKEIVEVKCGGKLHSDKYITNQTLMDITCVKGHNIKVTPDAVKIANRRGKTGQNLSCDECGGKKKETDADIEDRIKHTGYTFLGVSDKRAKNGEIYIWVKCPNPDHPQYEAMKSNFFEKDTISSPRKGCKLCKKGAGGKSKKDSALKAMKSQHKITPVNADEYKGNSVSIKWACELGHTFYDKLQCMHNRANNRSLVCPICDTNQDWALKRHVKIVTMNCEGSFGNNVKFEWQCIAKPTVCSAVFTATKKDLQHTFCKYCSKCGPKCIKGDPP